MCIMIKFIFDIGIDVFIIQVVTAGWTDFHSGWSAIWSPRFRIHWHRASMWLIRDWWPGGQMQWSEQHTSASGLRQSGSPGGTTFLTVIRILEWWILGQWIAVLRVRSWMMLARLLTVFKITWWHCKMISLYVRPLPAVAKLRHFRLKKLMGQEVAVFRQTAANLQQMRLGLWVLSVWILFLNLSKVWIYQFKCCIFW